MWYMVTITYEDGRSFRYAVKNMIDAMGKIAKAKASCDINGCKFSHKIEKVTGEEVDEILLGLRA